MEVVRSNLERVFEKELSLIENRGGVRSKALGYLIVVGGPGGTGLSSVARKLAERLGFSYIYGGEILREIGKKLGYEDVADFVKSREMSDSHGKFDLMVEKEIIKLSQQRDVIIDSKVFGAISTILEIPTSIKIWVVADLDVRTHRVFEKYKLADKSDVLDINQPEYIMQKQKLIDREHLDGNRYFGLYGIEYANPEKYNDIIFDTSQLDLESSVDQLMIKLKQMGIDNGNTAIGVNGTSAPVPGGASSPQTVPNSTPQNSNDLVEKSVAEIDAVHPEDLNERWTRWKCLQCNYLYEGIKPLMKCPRCGNEDPDKFD